MSGLRLFSALVPLVIISVPVLAETSLGYVRSEYSGYYFRLSVVDEKNKKHCLEVVTPDNCNNKG